MTNQQWYKDRSSALKKMKAKTLGIMGAGFIADVETRNMEERLNVMKTAIERDKEERKKRGGLYWTSGQKGKLNKYADKILTAPNYKMMKNLRLLTDEKVELPERYPSGNLSQKLSNITNWTGSRKETSSSKHGKQCGQCEVNKADFCCLQCTEVYCSSCFASYHKKGALRKHRSISLDISNVTRPKSRYLDRERTLHSARTQQEQQQQQQQHQKQLLQLQQQRQQQQQQRHQQQQQQQQEKSVIPVTSSNASGTTENETSLLNGEFHEEESAASFQQALQRWRSAGQSGKRSSPSLTSPAENASEKPCMKNEGVQIDMKNKNQYQQLVSLCTTSNTNLTYAERIMLKQHRQKTPQPIGDVKSPSEYDPQVANQQLDDGKQPPQSVDNVDSNGERQDIADETEQGQTPQLSGGGQNYVTAEDANIVENGSGDTQQHLQSTKEDTSTGKDLCATESQSNGEEEQETIAEDEESKTQHKPEEMENGGNSLVSGEENHDGDVESVSFTSLYKMVTQAVPSANQNNDDVVDDLHRRVQVVPLFSSSRACSSCNSYYSGERRHYLRKNEESDDEKDEGKGTHQRPLSVPSDTMFAKRIGSEGSASRTVIPFKGLSFNRESDPTKKASSSIEELKQDSQQPVYQLGDTRKDSEHSLLNAGIDVNGRNKDISDLDLAPTDRTVTTSGEDPSETVETTSDILQEASPKPNKSYFNDSAGNQLTPTEHSRSNLSEPSRETPNQNNGKTSGTGIILSSRDSPTRLSTDMMGDFSPSKICDDVSDDDTSTSTSSSLFDNEDIGFTPVGQPMDQNDGRSPVYSSKGLDVCVCSCSQSDSDNDDDDDDDDGDDNDNGGGGGSGRVGGVTHVNDFAPTASDNVDNMLGSFTNSPVFNYGTQRRSNANTPNDPSNSPRSVHYTHGSRTNTPAHKDTSSRHIKSPGPNRVKSNTPDSYTSLPGFNKTCTRHAEAFRSGTNSPDNDEITPEDTNNIPIKPTKSPRSYLNTPDVDIDTSRDYDNDTPVSHVISPRFNIVSPDSDINTPRYIESPISNASTPDRSCSSTPELYHTPDRYTKSSAPNNNTLNCDIDTTGDNNDTSTRCVESPRSNTNTPEIDISIPGHLNNVSTTCVKSRSYSNTPDSDSNSPDIDIKTLQLLNNASTICIKSSLSDINTPENDSNSPENDSNSPENDSNTPDIDINTPGILNNITSTCVKSSQSNINTPKSDSTSPDIDINTPGLLNNVSTTCVKSSQSNSNTPENDSNSNDIEINTPGLLNNISNTCVKLSRSDTNTPESDSNAPDIDVNVPVLLNNISSTCVKSPRSNANTPESDKNALKLNTNTALCPTNDARSLSNSSSSLSISPASFTKSPKLKANSPLPRSLSTSPKLNTNSPSPRSFGKSPRLETDIAGSHINTPAYIYKDITDPSGRLSNTPRSDANTPVDATDIARSNANTPVDVTNTPRSNIATPVGVTDIARSNANTPVDVTNTPRSNIATPVGVTETPESNLHPGENIINTKRLNCNSDTNMLSKTAVITNMPRCNSHTGMVQGAPARHTKSSRYNASTPDSDKISFRQNNDAFARDTRSPVTITSRNNSRTDLVSDTALSTNISRDNSRTDMVSDSPIVTKMSRNNSRTDMVSDTPIVTKTSRNSSRTDMASDTPIVTKTSRNSSRTDMASDTPIVTKTSRNSSRTDMVSDTPVVTKTSRNNSRTDMASDTTVVTKTSRNSSRTDMASDTPIVTKTSRNSSRTDMASDTQLLPKHLEIILAQIWLLTHQLLPKHLEIILAQIWYLTHQLLPKHLEIVLAQIWCLTRQLLPKCLEIILAQIWLLTHQLVPKCLEIILTWIWLLTQQLLPKHLEIILAQTWLLTQQLLPKNLEIILAEI
ncbi:finger B-box domain-containing 1-like isoform X2 [Octopus vulgaris]|uniref:Finger B-box domain-containing 1-like isoform X2 n=1 Tax=Octopus vulgaris TaxID=6645 RepID=A0AA36FKC2_OCTVU|nr:finger B-box domain-containing 1-like isoform X2 [Octopus vulgaris]